MSQRHQFAPIFEPSESAIQVLERKRPPEEPVILLDDR